MLEQCRLSCAEAASLFVKQSVVDKLLNRSVNEKIANYCHLQCLKDLGIKNCKMNGRWGFKMIFGVTEIFSSSFAFISFIFTYILVNYTIMPKLHKSKLALLIKLQYYICNIAFLSSTIFHMRETTFTRYADYFSAILSIVIGFLCALGRLIQIVKPNYLSKYTKYSLIIAIIFYCLHVYKMILISWDYVYNKIICGILFAASCIIDYINYQYVKNSHYSHNILLYIGALFVAGIAEVSDISPVMYLFDSHALWHLGMAVSGLFYFKFISGFITEFSKND